MIVGAVYMPPPADRIPNMLEQLRDWLWNEHFVQGEFLNGVIRAIVAHVYIAWIHPFDDGNGRTARAIEYGMLQAAGLPDIGATLMANHYNTTRLNYMEQLRRSSTEVGGNLTDFVAYALEGLHDSLSEALKSLREQVFESAWMNYVYETFRTNFGTGVSPSLARARSLALWMAEVKRPVSRRDIRESRVGAQYENKTIKTLSRDLRLLEQKLGLIERTSSGLYMADFTRLTSQKLAEFSRKQRSDDQQLNLPFEQG